MLLAYPFILLLAAGSLAGGSAVLLRRAEVTFGAWLGRLSVAASAAAGATFVAAFVWAASLGPAVPTFVQTAAGLVLAVAGSALAGWSLRVRGVGVLRSWRAERSEHPQPFRTLRRPVELGLTLCVLGLCWLRPSATVWICLAAWLTLWNAVLELGDWELRQRLTACRDYLKRTPRYVPVPWISRRLRRGG